ncbi:MAG: LicD family protein [Candidatus Heimdallarchaeaceae archaeon]
MKFIDVKTYMEKTKKIQLEMLLEVNRICKKYDINYQLYGGTLLGAIRHKGYIPWDDDIDICMMRKDYTRFLKVCEKELKPEFFLQTWKTDKYFINQFAKIRRNNTLFVEYLNSELKKMHHGVFIDIFPLDNVKPNTLIGKMQIKLALILLRLNLTRTKIRCIHRFENRLYRILCLSVHYLLKLIPMCIWNRIQKQILTMFENEETEYVGHLTTIPSKEFQRYLISREWFNDIIESEFEGHKFPIPRNYDKILTKFYGTYMKYPPIEEQKSRHYIVKIDLSSIEGE